MNGCFLLSNALCRPFCGDDTGTLCICYTARSLNPSGSPSQISSSVFHSFLAFFTSPACVGTYPHSVCMRFVASIWAALFENIVFCVYLFVLKCSTSPAISADNRMRETTLWLGFCFCQMFHFTRIFDLYHRSLYSGLRSPSDGWVIFYSSEQDAVFLFSLFFFLSFSLLFPSLPFPSHPSLPLYSWGCDVEGIHLTFVSGFCWFCAKPFK